MKSVTHPTARRAAGAACAGLCALVLAACAARPPMPPLRERLPASYASDAGWRELGELSPMPGDGAWWQVFGDPVLNRLETELNQHNQSLAAQLAVYEQAQAALEQARAAYTPVLQATAGATRSRSLPSQGGAQAAQNSFSAGLQASWEPDLWGSVRLQVEQGRANLQAAAGTLRYTRLSLQASLASTYLQLRTVDAQTRLAEATERDYARALQLTQGRYRAGVDTAANVAQARTQLLQAQTTRTDLQVTRRQLLDAVAVLAGRPAPGLRIAPDAQLPALPSIPAGVPAQLLLRRPDLAAAAQQVLAANAQVGIDQRAWLPGITLGASGGAQAATLAQLFSAPTLYWSLGPSLAATLFDGGLRDAKLRAGRAAYRQAVATYRQDVLQAMQQVQDNLYAQAVLSHEAEQQDEVVRAAEVSLRLALNQYKAGTADYLGVIAAQTTATSARNAVLSLRNRRYAAAVNLIAALGGSWGDTAAQPRR